MDDSDATIQTDAEVCKADVMINGNCKAVNKTKDARKGGRTTFTFRTVLSEVELVFTNGHPFVQNPPFIVLKGSSCLTLILRDDAIPSPGVKAEYEYCLANSGGETKCPPCTSFIPPKIIIRGI